MSDASTTGRRTATPRGWTSCARVAWRSSTTTAGATSGAEAEVRAKPASAGAGGLPGPVKPASAGGRGVGRLVPHHLPARGGMDHSGLDDRDVTEPACVREQGLDIPRFRD